jgi:hypothetical protein
MRIENNSLQQSIICHELSHQKYRMPELWTSVQNDPSIYLSFCNNISTCFISPYVFRNIMEMS